MVYVCSYYFLHGLFFVAVARAVGRALLIRVNAEQRDQRNNAEAERKVHALHPASGVDCCGHHGPKEAHHRHGQPEDRLVAVEGNEATQHRRPLGYEAPQSA